MSSRREVLSFALVSAVLIAAFFHESLLGGKVLSPGDVVYAQASFGGAKGPLFEPSNRLLMDPVLQFQPWLEFNRALLRRGRLPLWNRMAGFGAPHLANGQSAVFDPFHAIAYLGRLPEAHAWMAFARLWVAALGMFQLARCWRLGPWGRWFAGLAYPLCGFLVVWLLYPVTSVAVWMPWLFLASDRVLNHPRARTIAGLAVSVGLVLLGGHVQTSAHVLLAAGVYVIWRASSLRNAQGTHGRRCYWSPPPQGGRETIKTRGMGAWGTGVALGIALAAIEIIPLGVYLTRSPVWEDRAAERQSPWRIGRPRVLDAGCTILPYLYGSQRRGHPNLARALGVHNLNESAGGFAGLATAICLAPLAWSARKPNPRVGFLVGLVAFGALGAFGVPPVDNLLRAVPILNVTDNRRLTLWVAFGLVLLGGVGLDHLDAIRRGQVWKGWLGLWVVGAIGLLAASAAIGTLEPRLRARARAHYGRAAAESPGSDVKIARDRADRQVRQTLDFVPRYLRLSALQLLALAALATAVRTGGIALPIGRGTLLALTLLDLFGFGFGLNPAIAPADDRPTSPVIAYLRREVPPPARVLAVGAELPPNTLMRYGLADVRNYDSVELTRSLDWLAPLYRAEPGRPSRTSRREVAWAGVVRAEDRLRAAGVRAVVGSTPPPPGAFDRVDRVGATWIARLDPSPGARAGAIVDHDHGLIQVRIDTRHDTLVGLAETFDPGWRAEVDGEAVAVKADRGTFLAVPVSAGAHRIVCRYDPPEVRLALAISLVSLAIIATSLACPPIGRGPQKIGYRAWMARNPRVKIESMISPGLRDRLTAEG